MQKKNFQRGFSIIETLMIVSLVAILASLFIVAINPVTHSSEAKNALRWSHVNALLNAVYQYDLEHAGKPPPGVDGTAREVCNGSTNSDLCISNGLVNLSLLVPQYIPALPTDPTSEGKMGSGYSVAADDLGKLTVRALHTEDVDVISVSR